MKHFFFSSLTFCVIFVITFVVSCKDDQVLSSIDDQKRALLEKYLEQYNQEIDIFQKLANKQIRTTAYTKKDTDEYTLQFDDNQILELHGQADSISNIPYLGINKEGYWCYRLNGSEYPLIGFQEAKAPALSMTMKQLLTPKLSLDEMGCWQVTYDGNTFSRLNMIPTIPTEEELSKLSLFRSVKADESSETIQIETFAGDYVLTASVNTDGKALAWKKFQMKADDNVLQDYSYAGYDHGESEPKDGFDWGYEVWNVKEHMEKYQMTAFDAFIDILDKNNMVRKTHQYANNPNARIVVYFPEGEYVMYGKDTEPEQNYQIIAGNFVIKGDGMDKTRLVLQKKGMTLFDIKTMLGHTKVGNIVQDASKGTFQIVVSSTGDLKPGDWVELHLNSGDKELLAKELGPIPPQDNWAITKFPQSAGPYSGVLINDVHQIAAIDGNVITLYEPLMHDIEVKYNDYQEGWTLNKFSYYENVGIEDMTLEGITTNPYKHFDEGSQMIGTMRLLNSWVRNIHFVNVVEAVTFYNSAYCSIYNIRISGYRGHGAVRAAGSTRVFTGCVYEESADGTPNPGKEIGRGQWHGSGVSKPSIGTVVWRSTWGSNSCFESHASQPRATLFDCCNGGLVLGHAGGDASEVPNHLQDLTLWNLNVTGTKDESGNDHSVDIRWWEPGNRGGAFYPPIVVGTHGKFVSFSQEEGQLTYEESTGAKVSPESLYEAQLEHRLGVLPGWLQKLKAQQR